MVGGAFRTIQTEKRVFHEESNSRNTCKYSYTYTFFIEFKLVEQFQKGAGLQTSVDLYSGICLIFSSWASRALVYNGRNLWKVDLCNVDLCWWNWKGVDEAMNSMAIFQGGFNFIIQVSL